MENAWVISSREAKYSENAIYYFRKKYVLAKPKSAKISITAEARYKLHINGQMVSFGPYKSNPMYRRYNTVDISAYLNDGENDFLVEVLQLRAPHDFAERSMLASVPRNGNIALLIWGEAECEGGNVPIVTDDTWECVKNTNIKILPPMVSLLTGGNEKVSNENVLVWKRAEKLFEGNSCICDFGVVHLWHLKPHDLPAQRYEISELRAKDAVGNYDFGKLTTGFVKFYIKGKGTLKLTYAESYVFFEDNKMLKRDRTDCRGVINGDSDYIEVDGKVCFETFWFRTFRFIKPEITGDVTIEKIEVAETGYPLDIDDCYDFGNKTDNRLFEISVNTLKNCMHETYEDCPYYEQLQYTMDTYTQMIFNMRLSDDIRLVKNGIDLFATSLLAGDICEARFPCAERQYITGFCLYLIYMLDEVEKNRGEHEFIRRYLGTVENIIIAFENMKRSDGLICKNEYWNFVDWVDGWENGVPPSECGDVMTVYNFMYIYALNKAARLNRIFGRNDVASQYEKNADCMKILVKEKCYFEEQGLYADTDKGKSFSQHSQVWAVLCDADDAEAQREILKKSTTLKAKGGFAFAYLIFRAFEKAGVYELGEDLLSQYRKLIEFNCTTIPEIPENARSECHAWGAVLINEFTSVVLGVSNDDEKIIVRPYIVGRKRAKGAVYTKFGKAFVEWTVNDNKFNISVKADSKIEIILPNGFAKTGFNSLDEECTICE